VKTALVTGTTSGMGRQIALDLAVRGWRLLLPVRSPDQVGSLVCELRRVGSAEVILLQCDLSDPQQVRGLCERVASLGELDLVINNAGVGGGTDHSRREENASGTELRMAVNAVAPHVIAQCLAPRLRAGGRIVQVGSATQAELPLDDLNFEASYDGFEAYMRSKLALLMSAIALGAQGVPVNVVHPATQMPTKMVREDGVPTLMSIDDGAIAVLRMALDSELDGVCGQYFERFERVDPPQKQAEDAEARRAVVGWIEARSQIGPQ